MAVGTLWGCGVLSLWFRALRFHDDSGLGLGRAARDLAGRAQFKPVEKKV